MGKKLDLTGLRYGKLVAQSISGKTNKGSYLWEFLCDCGNTCNLISAVVRNGNTTSCGCRRSDVLQERNTTHGMSKHPAYSNWKDMFKRCYNKNNKRYELYASKGIVVHDSFRDFPTFLAEIGEKPDNIEVWTIGRKDNNLSYQPGNIRWETLAEQARNHSMQSNNTSGVVGIQLQVKTIAGVDYESFVATWSNLEGIKRTKNFSTNKFGFEGAKEMAIAHREQELMKLREHGVEYAESHGSVGGLA